VETSRFGHDLKGFMVGYLAVSLEIASTLFQEGGGFLGDQENAFQVELFYVKNILSQRV
ncbi:hypothetical protein RJ123_006586, partial [Pseudomonas aeruginosa]|nr:hypothetical protein [Pseudomonas aeruginosa]